MTYLIGISGPPRAGKDTLGAAIEGQLNARGVSTSVVALSMPMRLTVYAMLGMEYDLSHYELHKDDPQGQLDGKSIRQAMIALSEEHVKPTYGQDFWAQSGFMRAWRLDPRPRVIIVTDMGFPVEVEALGMRVGYLNAMWPQISRPGHDFSRDSRSYVGDERRVVRLDNQGEGLGFFITAARRVVDVAEHWGWKLS